MNEIELSKRLRTDDGDNLPVIGPGGVEGYWVQGEMLFVENKPYRHYLEHLEWARYEYIEQLRFKKSSLVQNHNPDGIRLYHALKEIERLKKELGK